MDWESLSISELSYQTQRRIAAYLDTPNSLLNWKDLLSMMPEYGSSHVTLLMNEEARGRSPTLALLNHMTSSGRRLGDLYNYCYELRMTRICDTIIQGLQARGFRVSERNVTTPSAGRSHGDPNYHYPPVTTSPYQNPRPVATNDYTNKTTTTTTTATTTNVSNTTSTPIVTPTAPILGSNARLPICVSFHKIYEATGHFNETLYANGGHKLGQGGFGSVFYCKMDIGNGEQEFAVKLFSNKEAKPTEKRMQFETELNTITKLNHPHMLPLLGYGSHQNSLCLIYPYMALGSLDKYLSKSEFNSHQRITVIQDIASALHYLHNGCNDDVLVHRDVKSANILLDPHWRGILTDFGIARTIDIGSSTVSTQRIIGTRVYMAPEYCTGVVSPAADVYSLGIVMYELLFGCLANDGPPNSNTDILSYLDEYDGITSDLYLSCWNEQDGDKLERLADNCTNEYRTSRPSIELILQTL